MVKENPTVQVETDASLTGWGACSNNQNTSGHFTPQEQTFHINILELLAIKFALQSLFQEIRETHILILSDNTTAVFSINKMGSTRSIEVDFLVRKISDWAITRGNFISVTHIPGRFNEDADRESRREASRTEWMLNKQDFHNVLGQLDFDPQIDLFASRSNAQLINYYSYRPDPGCSGVNAFTISWTFLDFYAFPPFAIIGKVLQKVQFDKAEGILIVPDWPSQYWFNKFINMTIHEIIIPPRSDLLQHPHSYNVLHPLHNTLQLRAALISGRR